MLKRPGELGRDGLHGNALVRERGENDQQLDGRLRLVGFVHRDFGDELARALGLFDMTVNRARFLHREQKFIRDDLDLGPGGLNAPPSMPGISTVPDKLGVPVGECFRRPRRFAGLPIESATSIVKKSDADRKRSTVSSRIWSASMCHAGRPAERLHRRGRRRPHGVRLGADDQVFAVGFVPDGHHVRAVFRGEDTGAQLRLRLCCQNDRPCRRIIFPTTDIASFLFDWTELLRRLNRIWWLGHQLHQRFPGAGDFVGLSISKRSRPWGSGLNCVNPLVSTVTRPGGDRSK